jgi:D-citramalate synthase
LKKSAKNGLKLNQEDLKLVTQRIIELGDKRKLVTKEDLPYIISVSIDTQIFEEK